MSVSDPTTQPPKNAPEPTKAKSDIVATTKTQCACKKPGLWYPTHTDTQKTQCTVQYSRLQYSIYTNANGRW